ncbi:MAG: MBOAT family protein [Spirochaetes bacterium]|nr:MBOAT family protein [Spirochaetota bacterium]
MIFAGSIIFYSWAAPVFLFVVLLSSFIDWALGYLISINFKNRKSLWLGTGVILNIALLAYFKYFNFFINNVNEILNLAGFMSINLTAIIMPAGLSFLVFQKISYQVDVYRGIEPQPALFSYLMHVLLFPKIMAGPIVKFNEINDQLESRNPDLESFISGLSRFCMGLAKKVFIAETLAEIANAAFSMNGPDLGLINSWLGAMAFTLQIYFDFSSYSDMAIGTLKMMGFAIPENFNMPYISESITEFWRRWHISLSTWIRDYIYFPLGGNRVRPSRLYFNLWACFLISGIWHGANWTFVVWGVYHGIFMVLERLFLLEYKKRLPSAVNMLATFLIVLFGWVIFRADNLTHALNYISNMLYLAGLHGKFIYISKNIIFFTALALILSFIPKFKFFNRLKMFYDGLSFKTELGLSASVILLFFSMARIAGMTFNPFLYLRF